MQVDSSSQERGRQKTAVDTRDKTMQYQLIFQNVISPKAGKNHLPLDWVADIRGIRRRSSRRAGQIFTVYISPRCLKRRSSIGRYLETVAELPGLSSSCTMK